MSRVDATCRFCGAALHDVFADLGSSPLANAYLSLERVGAMEPYYPLRALVCGRCFLVQLEQFETPARIFSDYAYYSSYSTSWLEHCRRYTEQMTSMLGLAEHSHVVELASNDGYLLQYFHARGIDVLGVEPAANIAQVAVAKGIPTVEPISSSEPRFALTKLKPAIQAVISRPAMKNSSLVLEEPRR